MPNVQQPEMRRSGETRLVQDSDGPDSAPARARAPSTAGYRLTNSPRTVPAPPRAAAPKSPASATPKANSAMPRRPLEVGAAFLHQERMTIIAGIGDPRFTPDKEGSAKIDNVDDLLDASGAGLAATIAGSGVPVDIALVHDPIRAARLDGAVGLVLAGHRHAREVSMMPAVPGQPPTRLMVGGSTGGAGLRGLEGETPTPLEMSLLYFDQTHALQAWDEITVGGSGTAEVTIRRQLAADDAAAAVGAPAPVASVSSSGVVVTPSR